MNTINVEITSIQDVYPLIDKITAAGYKTPTEFTWEYNNHFRSMFDGELKTRNVAFKFVDPAAAMWFKLLL